MVASTDKAEVVDAKAEERFTENKRLLCEIAKVLLLEALNTCSEENRSKSLAVAAASIASAYHDIGTEICIGYGTMEKVNGKQGMRICRSIREMIYDNLPHIIDDVLADESLKS